MSLRKLAQASDSYRTLEVHGLDVIFIKTQLKETLVNLREVCENAKCEKSTVA